MKEKQNELYATEDENVVLVEYKDSALQLLMGKKKQKLHGKGSLNNQITSLIFDEAKRAGN